MCRNLYMIQRSLKIFSEEALTEHRKSYIMKLHVLFEGGDKRMGYLLFFLGALWNTLGAMAVCGLCVTLFRNVFVSLMGGKIGRGIVMGTSVLGTPIHELGHALMCLLFGHRITAMKLWQPSSPDGRLGYVTHTYRPKNLYHILGNLFIGLGPIFSGLGVLTLAFWLGFPDTFSAYMRTASDMATRSDGFFSIFAEGLRILPRMLEELVHGDEIPLWGRILALVVILAVAQHVSLSLEDIKSSLTAIPLYLAGLLLLTLVCGIIGAGAMDAVSGALAGFAAYVTVLFVIVLVSSLLQLLVALPVWGIRMLFARR